VLVAVAGRVHRPGVVTLPAGARVQDAVAAAGGALTPADLGLINLAAKVSDGQQIIVGPGASGGGGGGSAGAGSSGLGASGQGSGAIDINAATVGDLDALPGVGPVLAQRIIDYREANGPFRAVDELGQVPGIGPRKLADLRARVRV